MTPARREYCRAAKRYVIHIATPIDTMPGKRNAVLWSEKIFHFS